MSETVIKTKKELIAFLKARSVEDAEIKWTCPKCGTVNLGAYYSHESRCGGDRCTFVFPRLNLRKVLESEEEATQIAKELQEYRRKIESQYEIIDDLECELGEERRRLESLKEELRDLKTCDLQKVKAEW
jgi:hypothetical protein